MILSILFAIALAKIKGYKASVIFRSIPLYPMFFIETCYMIFQVFVFSGNYIFVQYASLLKSSYMYVLIIPIIVYKLYVPALWGSGLVLIGTALNKFVIFANNGKMPIYPTLSKLTGYYKENAISSAGDSLHILGNSTTKFSFLTDVIDVGFSILSIGDVLIHSFVLIIVFYSIKAICLKNKLVER